MRRFRQLGRRLGLTLMAVFALGAVASASAAEPEVRFLEKATKAKFTSTSGSGTLETNGKKAITCTKGTSSGTIENNKGEATVTFTGCKQGAVACRSETAKGEKDAVETILMTEVKLKLVSTLNAEKELRGGLASTLTKGVLILCGAVKAEVRNSVIGEVTPINKQASEGKRVLTQKSGEQIKVAYSECDEAATFCKEVKEKPLEAKFGEKFEAAGEETSETVIYEPMVEFHIGAAPPSEPTKKESIGPGPNPGSPKMPKEECGKPVNCSTGNETEQQTDIAIAGRGPGLRVARTYNALAAAEAKEAGPWGFGWTGPYGARLELNAEAETATVFQDNGSAVLFYKSGETYTQGSWIEARLVKEGASYVYTLPDQSKLEFNSEGRLTKETDRKGNSVTLTYNKSNQLETVTDGAKRTLTFKYNGEGLVESVTDPLKHAVSYTYSSKNLASVTIEGKVRWEYTYESPHLLTTLTDGRKNSVKNEYDASHRVIKQVLAGHERKWKYGSTPGAETTLTEPNGSETLEKFNGSGEPTEIIRAKGVAGVETTTKYEYNSTFNVTKLTDPNKHETTYGYDAEGNRTSETDPNKDERKWTYDKKHNIETETTPEGETTTIKRNGNGEPEAIERPIGAETQKTEYKYNEKGDLTEAVDPLKHTTKYTHDAAGDKESEIDPEGNERTFKYNEDSQKIEETSPRKFTTKTERDEQGRPIKVTDPLTHVTEYKYDANGNRESETDGNKHTTKYTYNEENLPTKVEEPNKTVVETGYDSEGKMTSHTDGNKHTWEYKRNQLEQVTEEVDPLKHVTKKTYEKAGGLETLEDPEKHTTTYKYDESNRRKSVVYSTGKPAEVVYEYNKDSKVTKMTDGTGETKNTYDKLDRPTETTNGVGKVLKYEYDLNNTPTKITYPNKEAVTRAYDKDGRLEKVTDWNKKETSFKYNADSQLSASVFPAGAEEEDTYAYNEADQMSEVKFKGPKAASLGTLVYERDGDGQLKKTTTTILPGPASSEHKYDENDRLTEDNKQAYEYDKANNPTKIEGAGAYAYKEANELEKGPEATYAYNEDGRRTETKPTKGAATTYGYDQAGNLTSVERPKEELLAEIKDSYGYDGNNLRESQTINGTTTQLSWDTAEQLPLVLSDETNSYIYGPSNLPIEQISSGATTLYLHHDQQGSTRLLTNGKGETETAYTYNPYGKLNATTGTETTPLRYGAQYTSVDTGLIYLRARIYDPATAQFLSVDPALQTTGEPYAYVADNPLNGGDPTGMCGGAGQPPARGTPAWDRWYGTPEWSRWCAATEIDMGVHRRLAADLDSVASGYVASASAKEGMIDDLSFWQFWAARTLRNEVADLRRRAADSFIAASREQGRADQLANYLIYAMCQRPPG